jgi:hypothetical protein
MGERRKRSWSVSEERERVERLERRKSRVTVEERSTTTRKNKDRYYHY